MRGFTLIELVLIIGILAILSVLSIPFLQTAQVSSDLTTHTTTLTSTLRRAQYQALLGQNQSSWGVYFDSGNNQAIFFQGDSYASRNADFDLLVGYPESFSLTNDFGDEIVFALYSGQPSVSGVVQLSSPNNQTETILINSYGKIETDN